MNTYRTEGLARDLMRIADDIASDAARVEEFAHRLLEQGPDGPMTDQSWERTCLGQNVTDLLMRTLNTSSRIAAIGHAVNTAHDLTAGRE